MKSSAEYSVTNPKLTHISCTQLSNTTAKDLPNNYTNQKINSYESNRFLAHAKPMTTSKAGYVSPISVTTNYVTYYRHVQSRADRSTLIKAQLSALNVATERGTSGLDGGYTLQPVCAQPAEKTRS